MDYISILKSRIFDRIKNVQDVSKCNFFDLALPFEYWSAIKLYENDKPLYYHYNDIDPLFKEEYNLSRRDTGIDLCNKNDSIVQCKLRTNSLTWKEMATFFASQCHHDKDKNIWYMKWHDAILTRNKGSKLSYNLQENCSRFIDIQYDMNEFYLFCNKLTKSPPPIIDTIEKCYEKRDFQEEAKELIKNNENCNIYFSIPTGSGKTYIFSLSIVKNKKYLILVPFCILVEQTKDEILQVNPHLHNDIQCIGDGNNKFDSNKNITICVYNSVQLVGNLNNFYKVIVDEAHRIIKPAIYYDEEDNDDIQETYIKIIKNNVENNSNSLLFSATLDKHDNDKDIYYKVEIRDLIDKGILCDYQIKIPIFEDNANDATICKHILQNYQSIIIYCSSRKQGEKVSKLMNDFHNGCCEFIDCNTKKTKRKHIIERFKTGNLLYIVNVRVLMEGFNAKICNGVVLYNITSNDKTIVQIVGRCLRKYENKIYANIVIPFVNNDDSKEIQFVLKALAQNDKTIKSKCINKKLGGYIDIETVLDKDLDDEDDDEDDDKNILEAKFEVVFDSLGKCIRGNVELWRTRLKQVKKFIDKNSKRPSEKEKQLYSWISRQLQNYKDRKQIMKEQEIYDKWLEFINDGKYSYYMLDNIQLWKEKLKKVKEFIDENNRRPSSISKDINEKQFGSWISKQLNNAKNRTEIMKEQEIYDEWENFINDDKYSNYMLGNIDLWKRKLKEVKQFINENNKRPFEKSKDINEKYLGKWIGTQISNAKDKKQIMKEKEIYEEWENFINDGKYSYYMLDNIQLWKEKLKKVKEFIDENNRRPSSISKDINEKYLGKWISHQISNYKQKKQIMKEDEIQKEWLEFINDDKYKQFFKHYNITKTLSLDNK